MYSDWPSTVFVFCKGFYGFKGEIAAHEQESLLGRQPGEKIVYGLPQFVGIMICILSLKSQREEKTFRILRE